MNAMVQAIKKNETIGSSFIFLVHILEMKQENKYNIFWQNKQLYYSTHADDNSNFVLVRIKYNNIFSLSSPSIIYYNTFFFKNYSSIITTTL